MVTNRTFKLRSEDTWEDPWQDYAALRDHGAVHAVVTDDHRYWVLPRFSEVFNAVRDTTTYSSAMGLTPDADGMVLFEDGTSPIVMMDPPDHTAIRRLVSRPMTPRAVGPLEPRLTAFVDKCLDRIDESAEVDIVSELFKPLPSFLVAQFLGVPESERGQFDQWTAPIVAANASGDFGDAAEAALAMFTYAEQLIERRRTSPGDDLVSDLVAAGTDAATVPWIVGFVFTMVTGGNDTTTGLLSGAAELLDDHRDQRRLLVDDPSLIRPSVEEFLRLTSPVQNLARTATCDVEIDGTTVARGDKVLLLYGSANRDEREFGADAGDLDVTRRPARHLALGYGAHHCLGAAAARLAAAVALERLLDRFPRFSVDTDAATFAPGGFVRRRESLPFRPRG